MVEPSSCSRTFLRRTPNYAAPSGPCSFRYSRTSASFASRPRALRCQSWKEAIRAARTRSASRSSCRSAPVNRSPRSWRLGSARARRCSSRSSDRDFGLSLLFSFMVSSFTHGGVMLLGLLAPLYYCFGFARSASRRAFSTSSLCFSTLAIVASCRPIWLFAS